MAIRVNILTISQSIKVNINNYSRFCSHDNVALLSNGVFAVNKPKNMRSVEAVDKIKSAVANGIPSEYLDSLKVGHGGVLDSTATGVLAIGVFRGCKLLPKFLFGVKQYVVTGQLGISTSTFNETGEVTNEMPYDHVTKDNLLNALRKFRGQIMQVPPVYSALKLHGRRYSDLAREGKEVCPKPRTVHCHSVTCSHFHPPFFTLNVKCGHGFYIRSLVDDLGKDLNCCAHVRELHRTQHGAFKEEDALTEDHWTFVNILKAIQKVKKKYNRVFIVNSRKNMRIGIDSDFENEVSVNKRKTILFEEDMFDL